MSKARVLMVDTFDLNLEHEVFDEHPDFDPLLTGREPLPQARELKRIGPFTDRLIASPAFIVGASGPVGCGKTIGFATKFQHHATKQKGRINRQGQLIRQAAYLWVRDTYPNVDANLIPSWHKVVPKNKGRFVAATPRFHEFSMVLKRDGHLLDPDAKAIDIVNVKCQWRALGDQSVDVALQGAEFSAGMVDEADKSSPDVVTYMVGRVGRFGDLDPEQVVDPFIGLGQNGCDDENYTYKLLVDQNFDEEFLRAAMLSSGGRKLIDYIEYPPAILEGQDIPGGWMVNPVAENLGNLLPGYYPTQYAFAKKQGNQIYIDRMLLGKFTPPLSGRSVFPEYVEEFHAGEFEAVPGIPLLVWADQGILGAVVIAQVVKGQVRILEEIACVFEDEKDEIHVVQMGGETLGKQVRELLSTRYSGFEIGDAVCDPAGAAGEGAINHRSWRQDFQKGLGHRVRKSRVPKNAIEPRLKAVRKRFAPLYGDVRGMLVHKRCKMVRRAFRTKYYYVRIGRGSGDGTYSDTPKKVQGYADLMDAIQYGCFELDKGLGLTSDGEYRIGTRRQPIRHDSDFDALRGR
jgi:hypothetical protein